MQSAKKQPIILLNEFCEEQNALKTIIPRDNMRTLQLLTNARQIQDVNNQKN